LTLDFPDGPGWLGLFLALYTLTAYGDGRTTPTAASWSREAATTVGTERASGRWGSQGPRLGRAQKLQDHRLQPSHAIQQANMRSARQYGEL
jgi:hypothetical protein